MITTILLPIVLTITPWRHTQILMIEYGNIIQRRVMWILGCLLLCNCQTRDYRSTVDQSQKLNYLFGAMFRSLISFGTHLIYVRLCMCVYICIHIYGVGEMGVSRMYSHMASTYSRMERAYSRKRGEALRVHANTGIWSLLYNAEC